jgi:hypothetical protein
MFAPSCMRVSQKVWTATTRRLVAAVETVAAMAVVRLVGIVMIAVSVQLRRPAVKV